MNGTVKKIVVSLIIVTLCFAFIEDAALAADEDEFQIGEGSNEIGDNIEFDRKTNETEDNRPSVEVQIENGSSENDISVMSNTDESTEKAEASAENSSNSNANEKKVSSAITGLAAPELKQATASSGKIKISWKSVNGASGYRVFRKTKGGSWKAITYTSNTSYKDSDKLKVGTTYYYTVRAYKGSSYTAMANKYSTKYWSGYDTNGISAKAVSVISTPKLSSAKASSGKIKVKWKSVSGAAGYRVFRKTKGGSWKSIKTTTNTSYTDSSKLKAGTIYYYTVRAYKGSSSKAKTNTYYTSYWSGYNSSGVSAKAKGVISTPKLTSATASAGKIKVKWKSVSKASGYRVYRKKSGGSWKKIATTTSTSYTDSSGLKSGTTYYYTVRAYKGSSSKATANTYYTSYWSGYDSKGVSAKAYGISTPVPTVTRGHGTTKVSWSKVSGASGYRVYRKKYGGSWSALGNTTSTSYTDKNVKRGVTYYYTVRAYKGDYATAKTKEYDSKYWSGYVKSYSGSEIVSYAKKFLGNPYLWDGTSLTKGCDCSGFVAGVYGHFGVSLPHYSFKQAETGYKVSYSKAKPGDLIFYRTSGPTGGHIGIYIGNGQMISAKNKASGICIHSVNSKASGFTVRRIF